MSRKLLPVLEKNVSILKKLTDVDNNMSISKPKKPVNVEKTCQTWTKRFNLEKKLVNLEKNCHY